MFKHIKVDIETHTLAKELANKKGMTLQGYIKKIVALDENKISEKANKLVDYRRRG